MTRAIAALAITIALTGAGHADPPGEQCYQKLLYRICSAPDGQWHIETTPALPLPGPGPAPVDTN